MDGGGETRSELLIGHNFAVLLTAVAYTSCNSIVKSRKSIISPKPILESRAV